MILELADPSSQIPHPAGLLTPVEQHLSALRKGELTEAESVWQQRYDEETQLGQGSVDDATLCDLTAPLRHLKTALDAAQTIDAVRARRSGIDARAQGTMRQLVDTINTPQPIDDAEMAPRVRPIVTLNVRTLTSKSLLETEADLEAFLQRLETRLR